MLYERVLRPWLFCKDPEEAHDLVTSWLSAAQSLPFGTAALSLLAGTPPPGQAVEAFGLKFPNPVGLAAGFDKDCRLARSLAALGFGFLELGSVTLKPQEGNEKPRMFRLPEHKALINRMGFNSCGAEAAARHLKSLGRLSIPIGINLGLNKGVPPDEAPALYAKTFSVLQPYGDYFAVNVSSPNTTGLRDLQEKLRLQKILTAIRAVNADKKPLLIKISPDLSDEALADIVEVVGDLGQGLIISNTTISRDGIFSDVQEIRGGLSGAPLRRLSTELILKTRRLDAKIPIIGVGGVFTGGDALEKLDAGASLVQIYTSLVYRGPSAAVDIQKELQEARA